jgi:Fe-coproporphyrin III synthase
MLKRLLNSSHRLHQMPIFVLMPHSRCNCRCVMCDIWKANSEKRELTPETLELHLQAFRKLGVRRVALSGGEALLHANLWRFCELLRGTGAKISLLTTGISLKNHAADVIKNCDDVIVSLDGSREIHNAIRNIPLAFEKLEEGVKAVKSLSRSFRVTSRTVLQKQNFRDVPNIVQTAREMGIDQMSFLPADVSSEAFNRKQPWDSDRVSQVALTEEEASELSEVLHQIMIRFKMDFENGFFAESKSKLLDIPQYYKALSNGNFPKKKCNAPWVSAVIESNGDVMPCFFHKPYGNIYSNDLEGIINSKPSIDFRRHLNVQRDAICQRCVCSIHVPFWQSVN